MVSSPLRKHYGFVILGWPLRNRKYSFGYSSRNVVFKESARASRLIALPEFLLTPWDPALARIQKQIRSALPAAERRFVS
jgi:hypothetical protein